MYVGGASCDHVGSFSVARGRSQSHVMALSEDVRYISLHKPLPLLLHGYVAPFLVVYVSLLSVWLSIYGFWEYLEAFMIVCAVVAGVDIVTCLFCVWSVHVRCYLTCRKVCPLIRQASSIRDAKLVKVVPTPNNGSTELVPLVKEKHKVTGEQLVWFIFQKAKYVYDSEGQFRPLEFPVNQSYGHYHRCRGYSDETQVSAARQTYGKNRLGMTIPDFWALFKERATAPFFVFQVFCVGLWCLDEYWYYSVFTLFMLVTFEAVLVKQQQRNLSEIRKMGAKPYTLQVYRSNKWLKMSSEELLPGDIVSIGRSKDGDVVPCDILLLKGPCIVDESMLTGESVPQMKEPLDDSDLDETLDLQRDSRLHVISGGTKIVQHTSPEKSSPGLRAPDGGCIGYVLRTGFNTSQGKLLRTILYGVKRVTANNLETFIFIMFLLVFAIAAASYVWIKGTENPERNRYKLFLECTLILTSVVPPELPIELSLAVNTSLLALARIGIYCTEPFRIPFGGKVDVCCFDKTGTLTSDNLVIQGIAGLKSPTESSTKLGIIPVKEAPPKTQYVLASCHSLALLDGELVGDPLEKAALSAIEWSLSRGDTVSPRRGRKCTLKIAQRFHFSSALKRMSSVCALIQPGEGPTYLATVKGAPEVLREMFSSVPDYYNSVYTKLTKHGARVLALGYRDLGSLSLREVHDLKRQDVEHGLTFAGFIVISCPLKEDSRCNIQCLHDSSHHVVMLTGDNPLTACHVAKELQISKKKLLILTLTDDRGWVWQSVSGATTAAMETKPSVLGSTYDLCLTGDGLSYLLTVDSGKAFRSTLPYVKVFARVAPKQKELVVTTYKSMGFYTLMCGDGTNDVGALKHAHVGVALLSTVPMQKDPDSSTKNSSAPAKPEDSKLTRSPLHPQSRSDRGSKSQSAIVKKDPIEQLTPQQMKEKRLRELMKKLEDVEPQMVRLGDASIASPFTSRHSSITCICNVVKQGRCTLVTTLQMFKILALNALIFAYSQSVLYLDGIKFSDVQATIQGFLLAGCFLFISRSKPLTTLSKERPLPNIFNLYTILTVICQFVVHFTCLIYLVQEAKKETPPSEEEFVDLEKEFEKNELNSAVYLISMAMQISNFVVNYKGHPFMASLTENKALLYSLLISATVVFVLASGVMPELSASLDITPFSQEFHQKLLVVLLADFACSYVVDRTISFFLGTGRLKIA